MIRSRDIANSGVFVGSQKEPKRKLWVATAVSSVAFVTAAEGYSGYRSLPAQACLLVQRFVENHLRTTGEPESLDASVGFLRWSPRIFQQQDCGSRFPSREAKKQCGVAT
jgi:hypothetical protein